MNEPRLNQTVRDEILQAVETGMPLRHAADLIPIPFATVRQEMLADETFHRAVRRAQARVMLECFAKLRGASPWQAARFLLETRWAALFGRRRRLKARPAPPDVSREQLARLNPEQLRQYFDLLKIMNETQPSAGLSPDTEVSRGDVSS